MSGALPRLARSIGARAARWRTVQMFREDKLLWRLTVALSVASLFPMLLTPFLPLVDLGSHIGAAGLLDDLITRSPVVSERYAVNLAWLPYWTGYLLLGALDVVGGPFFAAKATIAIVVLLIPLAHMRLLVALGRSPRLGLWAFLLCWDVNLYWGWFTFQLGMALALWALAWLVEVKDYKQAVRVIPLTAVVALTHLHAVALLGLAGVVLALVKESRWRSLAVHVVAMSGLAALLPWVISRLMSSGTPGQLSFQQTPFHDKISQLYQYSLNTMPGAVTVTLWCFLLLLLAPAALSAFASTRTPDRSGTMAVGVLGSCLALYLALPFQVSGALNHFWTFPRYGTYLLLLLLVLPAVDFAGRRAWLLAPGVVLVLLSCWERSLQFSAYGDRTRPYLDIISAMKPNTKFLPLDYEFHWPGTIQPTLGQLHGYAAAARAAYDPHLFDHDNSPIVFRAEGRPPEPNWFQPAQSFSMEAQGRFYDYIIVHPKSLDTQMPPAQTELVREAGEWRLYAVKHPAAPSAEL